MSGFHPIERIKAADKDSFWKWALILGGGFLGFLATIFDTRIKDKKYEARLDKEIQAQAKRLMEENKAA